VSNNSWSVRRDIDWPALMRGTVWACFIGFAVWLIDTLGAGWADAINKEAAEKEQFNISCKESGKHTEFECEALASRVFK
jgi:hypothetical protein